MVVGLIICVKLTHYRDSGPTDMGAAHAAAAPAQLLCESRRSRDFEEAWRGRARGTAGGSTRDEPSTSPGVYAVGANFRGAILWFADFGNANLADADRRSLRRKLRRSRPDGRQPNWRQHRRSGFAGAQDDSVQPEGMRRGIAFVGSGRGFGRCSSPRRLGVWGPGVA